MIDQKNVEAYCLQISRLTRHPDHAREFVESLLEVDWEKVFREDTAPCARCKIPVPLYMMQSLSYKEGGCAECYHYITNGYERTCRECKEKFLSYSWSDYSDCLACRRRSRRESAKISTHLGCAGKRGLPATLTLVQWYATLRHFHWKCAYCLDHPYTNFEHFLPLCKGGGTTQSNCVPACKRCNNLKGRCHPDHVTLIPRKDIERVQAFLARYA